MKFEKIQENSLPLDSFPSISKHLLVTLGVLLFSRIGNSFPIPGVSTDELQLFMDERSNPFINPFSIENSSTIGLFNLNIFPYINASIVIQLIISVSPEFAQLQKEGDLKARRFLNQLRRFLTLIAAIIQSLYLGFSLHSILVTWNNEILLNVVVWLTTGAMIVLWLSELVNDYGLGNGTSVLISGSILANLPSLIDRFRLINSKSLNIFSIGFVFLLTCFSIFGIFMLQDSMRCLPLLSAKQLNQYSKKKPIEMPNYVPLLVNQAGIMPILLTTTVLVIPTYKNNLALVSGSEGIIPDFPLLSRVVYWGTYFGLILFFSFLYSTVALNPKDISDQLQKMAVKITKIRPGSQTTFYLKKLMNRLTILGSFLLATLATLPNLLQGLVNISSLNGLSTSSFLIMAGTIMELTKKIDDIVFSDIYGNKIE